MSPTVIGQADRAILEVVHTLEEWRVELVRQLLEVRDGITAEGGSRRRRGRGGPAIVSSTWSTTSSTTR